MAHALATRTFNALGNASEADRTIFSGSGILFSVIVSSGISSTAISFNDEADNLLFSIVAPAGGNQKWDLGGGVVLDNGIVFDASGSGSVAVSAVWRPQ